MMWLINVSKTYPNDVRALRDITLESKGEFLF